MKKRFNWRRSLINEIKDLNKIWYYYSKIERGRFYAAGVRGYNGENKMVITITYHDNNDSERGLKFLKSCVKKGIKEAKQQ